MGILIICIIFVSINFKKYIMKKIIVLCLFLLTIVSVKADLILPDDPGNVVTGLNENPNSNNTIPDLNGVVYSLSIEQINSLLVINNLCGKNIVYIIDMSGHVVLSQKIITDTTISISELKKGFYIVMVNNITKRIYKN